MKEAIVKLLKKHVDLSKEEIENLIEVPPTSDLGDFAFPCFVLSKKLKQAPHEIAVELRAELGNPPKGFETISTQGPYINFFVDRKQLALNLIDEIFKQKEKYGKISKGKIKTMVEFPSPNTNKPLHLGHLRNMAIGESVSRILESNGENVIRANLNNDRGIHICKSMLAYQKWGKNKKPSKKLKSDHLVGEFYVMFDKKSKKNAKIIPEAHELLRKWEQGDKITMALWKKMNKWALDGFKETYYNFGIKHDKEYFESKIYTEGKDIILEGLKKGIFQKEEDGSVSITFEDKNLGKKYLLRADGTALYMTQDIYLAKLKVDNFRLDKSIYITGNEQEYHFNVLFKVIEKLGWKIKDNLIHLPYGMVFLPEGKMKSREGQVVDADNLIEKVKKLVQKELKSREKISKKVLEERSQKIALAAIKYLLLKIDVKKNTIFNPKESINFEGDTGPYILYSYARASSILRKAKKKSLKKNLNKLEEKEIELVKKLSEFKNIIGKSYETLNPSLIANYSYQLSKIFNEFYHACPVIGSDKENFRLQLIKSFRIVLKNSMNLLGIDVVEQM